MQNKFLNLSFPKYSFDSSFFLCFLKTSCFISQHCNKIIGTYFEKCGKVGTLSNNYKMICIDEYCQSRDKKFTCDTYAELSRLCSSDGPGTYVSWRDDPDVVCGRFQIYCRFQIRKLLQHLKLGCVSKQSSQMLKPWKKPQRP